MKKFWNSDKIVSTSAIVIGVGSLIVVTYQTNLIRNQTELIQREQRTSVMPYLKMGSRTPEPGRAEIYLTNSGLGPALVKEVRIRNNSKSYAMDLTSYFLENYQYEGYLFVNRVETGELIPAADFRVLIGANSQDSAFVEFVKEFDEEGRSTFEIVYESLYGESWLLSSAKNAPVRLEEKD